MIARPEHFEHQLDVKREREQIMEEENMTDEQKEFVRANSCYDPFFESAPDYCFYCGEKMTIPAVMWHGCHSTDRENSAELWLHPKCAEELCMKLLRDTNELRIGKEEADKRLLQWKRENV